MTVHLVTMDWSWILTITTSTRIPYPYYQRLRDEAPLYRNEELNFWAVSRHRDVHQGFRNSTTLSNRDGVSLDPVSRGPHASKTMSFLAMDDPAHLRLRTLVSKGFTPRRIRELEPRVTEIALQHLETMLEKAASGGTRPRLHRGIRRQAADGRYLRTDGRTRIGPRPPPRHGRRRDAPRGRRHRRAGFGDRGVASTSSSTTRRWSPSAARSRPRI